MASGWRPGHRRRTARMSSRTTCRRTPWPSSRQVLRARYWSVLQSSDCALRLSPADATKAGSAPSGHVDSRLLALGRAVPATDSSAARRSASGEAADALGDDVELNLGRPAADQLGGDRQVPLYGVTRTARRQRALGPRPAQDGLCRPALVPR